MIVIACVDEKGGMMFHHRRQSQDRVLREDVLRECEGKKLYMSPYSYGMFETEVGGKCKVGEGGKRGKEKICVWERLETEICIREDFLEGAGQDEFCFVEGQDISGVKGQIDAVILYQWNRRYPADVYFALDLKAGGWELEKREELKGFSHERITKEVYRKAGSVSSSTVKSDKEINGMPEN